MKIILQLLTLSFVCLNANAYNYTIPLRFDVSERVQLKPLEFSYDLESSKGQSIKIFDIDFSPSTYSLSIENKPDSSAVLKILWPARLIRGGTIEAINQSGKSFWSYNIPMDSEGSISISDLEKNAQPLFTLNQSVRFCLSEEAKQFDKIIGFTRLCTAYYRASVKDKKISLKLVKQSSAPARVISYGQQAKIKDNIIVENQKPFQFYAETSNGYSYEFNVTPRSTNLVEAVYTNDKSTIQLVTEGPEPVSPKAENLNKSKDSYWVNLLGLQSTIGDLRQFWVQSLPQNQNHIFIIAPGGGLFLQSFNAGKLPSENMRIMVDEHTIKGTYIDGAKIYGSSKNSKIKIGSKQNFVKGRADNFKWYFKATEDGKMNKSYLLLKDEDELFKTYYEVYKGHPAEISARITGLLGTNNNAIVLGEFAFNYWFEDIFGLTDYYLTRERWGFSAKYFRSLNPIVISSISSALQTTTLDLKYRLNPGLWERDETVGLSANFQESKYDQFDAQMFGAGIFWARSMPKSIDDFLNLAPFLRYPKWFDVEFIYYLGALNSGVSLQNSTGGNYELNFHGKVLWTERWFGEAGFGIRQLSFSQNFTSQQLTFSFTSLYGTVGVGLNF